MQDSKIFYLFEDKPLENGILDMENLEKIKDDAKNKDELSKKYVQGPYSYFGSHDFTVVYKYGQDMIYKGRIYQQPDCQCTSLVADYEKQVDLTTFLDSGEILLKIKFRFMIFDKTGDFIDEIEFKDIKEEQVKENLEH